MKAFLKERLASLTSGFSGIASLLGGYNICHSACLALLAGLALIGISVKGMPLEFLQTISIPLWTIGVLMLGLSFFLYMRKMCISKNLLAANSGILLVAIPFRELESFQVFFVVFGVGIVAVAIFNFISERRKKK